MIAAFMTPDRSDSTRSVEIQAWLEVNKMRLAAGAAIVGLVIAVVAIIQWRKKEAERAASAALVELQIAAAANPDLEGPQPSSIEQVAAEHSGTKAAARAHMFAAEGLFRDGHYAEAKAEFEAARAVVKDAGLAAIADYGVAASLDALGKTAEAMTAYQEVTVRHATAGVAGQARLAMAGLHEQQGNVVQALAAYNELTGAVGSPWQSAALERREALLRRHPELAPTNTVPTIGGGLTNAGLPIP
jgi:predicted negative regulator of RcsB-dependent stress response